MSLSANHQSTVQRQRTRPLNNNGGGSTEEERTQNVSKICKMNFSISLNIYVYEYLHDIFI